MFRWEPEGRYRHRLCTAIAPFWFSTPEYRWIVITPFWLSLDDISVSLPIETATTWYGKALTCCRKEKAKKTRNRPHEARGYCTAAVFVIVEKPDIFVFFSMYQIKNTGLGFTYRACSYFRFYWHRRHIQFVYTCWCDDLYSPRPPPPPPPIKKKKNL